MAASDATLDRITLREGLQHFPEQLFEKASTLHVLDLSGNDLSELPNEFACFQELRILFLTGNRFKSYPPVLSRCPKLELVSFKSNGMEQIAEGALGENLRWLILTDNKLTSLPNSIGALSKLQKLALAHNQLQTLPENMAQCVELELLRISANMISTLPRWLPRMPKLAWLGYAGNSCAAAGERELPDISWSSLIVGDTLGAGASGTTLRGELTANSSERIPVAIKLFGEKISADGLPGDEMRACAAVGNHPNLIETFGKIVGHPQSRSGIVFRLLAEHAKKVGEPPDFSSCSRDTYPAGTYFSSEEVFRIAQGVSCAAAKLHSHGVLHGDLYAHNTLHSRLTGEVKLGDLGAATLYPRSDMELASSLEKIEIRAFGILLEELLDHAPSMHRSEEPLRALSARCTSSDNNSRPLFAEITKLLHS